MHDDGFFPDALHDASDLSERPRPAQFVVTPARIMVVIRGRLLRDCVQRIMESPSRIVVGSCETLKEVESAIGSLSPPDLFIVEFDETKQIAAMFSEFRALKARMPAARWIALSLPQDQQFLRTAAEIGVDAIMPETASFHALQLVTELVLMGHSCLPAEAFKALSGPDVAPSASSRRSVWPALNEADVTWPASRTLCDTIGGPAADDATGGHSTGEDRSLRRKARLSEREKQILTCLVAGHSNKLIARDLGIAETTVKVHVKALLRKMQVANRTEAAIRARQFLGARGAHA